MNFQSKPGNTMAKFSEGRFFKVLVITGTVHYSWFDISNVYPIPFESRNAMFTQLIDQNDEKRCQLVDYSGISDSVQNESACDHHRGKHKNCFESDWYMFTNLWQAYCATFETFFFFTRILSLLWLYSTLFRLARLTWAPDWIFSLACEFSDGR